MTQTNGTDSVCATHGRPGCPVCAYNADLDKRVAATPSRDWQKDMQRVKDAHHARTCVNQPFPRLAWQEMLPEPWEDVAEYWLQEAKTLKEIASGRGRETLRLRKLLGALNDELTASEERAYAAEAREQRLKEEYEKMLKYLPKHVQAAYGFDEFLTTLYPDTPAPTNEEV